MTITLNGTTGITAPTYNGSVTSEYSVPVTAFKNRIINGDMRIDQRNAGASVSISANTTTFITDRFNVRYATGSGHTSQQSTTSATGFVKSLLFTVGTGASAAAAANNRLLYNVEGNDIADLAWGTANAKTVTLSFWVRSSLTGTFSFAFQDATAAYNYIGTYTINSANTFEQKTVTITGPTSGTWNTDNTVGIQILFDLGSGSNYDGTAGWSSTASVRRTSGSVRLIETSGATFYITGVQLEVGSNATSFDRRPYGTELALCQRYYWQTGKDNTYSNFGSGFCNSTTVHYTSLSLKQTMRTTPTLTTTGTASNYQVLSGSNTAVALSSIPALDTVNLTTDTVFITSTVASGLTSGQGGMLRANNTTSAFLGFNAEL